MAAESEPEPPIQRPTPAVAALCTGPSEFELSEMGPGSSTPSIPTTPRAHPTVIFSQGSHPTLGLNSFGNPPTRPSPSFKNKRPFKLLFRRISSSETISKPSGNDSIPLTPHSNFTSYPASTSGTKTAKHTSVFGTPVPELEDAIDSKAGIPRPDDPHVLRRLQTLQELQACAYTGQGQTETCLASDNRLGIPKLTEWWYNNVTVLIPEKSRRDFLALERTYLAYIRTSLALVMFSVLLAQLMRLQKPVRGPSNRKELDYFTLSVPLAGTGIVSGMVVALLGSIRFFQHQNAIGRRRAVAGGIELLGVGILAVSYLFAIFILFVTVSVQKSKLFSSLFNS